MITSKELERREAAKRRKKAWRKGLRDIVNDAEETRQEIADAMKIDDSTLSDYLNGSLEIPPERIEDLVAAAPSVRVRLSEYLVGAGRSGLTVLADSLPAQASAAALSNQTMDLVIRVGRLVETVREAFKDGVLTLAEFERIVEEAHQTCRDVRTIERTAERDALRAV